MNPLWVLRRRTSVLVAVVSTAAVLVALATAVGNRPADAMSFVTHDGTTHGDGTDADSTQIYSSHQHHGEGLLSPRTKQQVAFHDQMRRLWEDHITWTRLAIVTFADGSAGFDATAARLLRNQTDIGDAIKPYYGEAAGAELTALLRDHITIAVELLQAAKAGDVAAFDAARARWYANSDDIADFLASANPRWWPQDQMRAAMKAHLDQTLAEAAHELGGDHAGSVADYEAIHQHILAMADQLSSGVMSQFPEKFKD